MTKEVTVEELREHLEEIIAEVQSGVSVTIVKEKGTGIRIVQEGRPFPLRGFVSDAPTRKFTKDSVDLIREDRDSEFEKYK